MKLSLFLLTFLTAQSLFAQDGPLWLRYSAISPDGSTICFSYGGDLYTVNSEGGKANLLTIHEAIDRMPVWSKDSKSIAFASNRFGNYDVFIMPAEGGKAVRLTFHSANDYPSDFTPDNQSILFSSSRTDDYRNQLFPSGVMSELYSIPAQGGRAQQVLTLAARNAKMNDAGLIIYNDVKGYEDSYRKHHTSSVTRDIWVHDSNNGGYTKLSVFEGEDMDPEFSPAGDSFYYLSEENGDFNVYRRSLDGSGASTQITSLEKHPVRHLSVSTTGLMCFSYDGQLYTMREGESPNLVSISINLDGRYNETKTIPINGGISSMAVSPNGKEVAFISRGEVFVSSVEKGTTKRITNTPEQERTVDFSPDGRAILYAGERDGSWNLYETKLAREEEKYFFNSTTLKEEALLATSAETFQPSYSPDGKEVAYIEERVVLKVINLETRETREILGADKNYSYADGDQFYDWSPDSKWFLVNYLEPETWVDQAGLISADGNGEVINLTQSGYSDYGPTWMMDGNMMIWFSRRDGMENHGSWGGEMDIYGMFFNPEAWDKFNLSEEEFKLLDEDKKDEDKDEEEDKKKKKKKDEDEKKEEVEPLTFDLDNVEYRKKRLTIHSSRLSDGIVSKDGASLYYLTRFEKGYDLWETNLRTKETKKLIALGSSSGGSLVMDKEGKALFVLAGGKISKVDLGKKENKPIGVGGEMVLNESVERAYLFEHAWRQVVKKFYVEDLHGVDWDFYKSEYAKFLPHINNNYDFADMLSELLGELNASHTGAGFRNSIPNPDQTAALGLFYDNSYSGDGLRIAEVMKRSPVEQDGSKIKAGVIIEKINGKTLERDQNIYPHFNRQRGKKMLLSLHDPSSNERWEETVTPISGGAENQLKYERWIRNCRAIVDSLSNGKVGYVHVRGMNDASYRTVYEEVLGKNANKEALIVDTRFNGGGWLANDLATFLNGEKYLKMFPRGQNLGYESQFKWHKPSAVVMSESNYSDAHIFPFTYRALGVGKLIGMPVPGTGTAVWWESLQNRVWFGIPEVGMMTMDGEYLENTQLEPDIKVALDPEAVTKGRDQQLEAAVQSLLGE